MERLPISEMTEWPLWVQVQFQGRARHDQLDAEGGERVIAPDITEWLPT